MQPVRLAEAMIQDSSGPGMVRVEYMGKKAGTVTYVGPTGKNYQVSSSPSRKYVWMPEKDANYFCHGLEFRRAAPVAQSVEPSVVATPAVQKVQNMVQQPPPTVKEVLKKKRGPKPKAK